MNLNRFFKALDQPERIAFASLLIFLIVIPLVKYNHLIDLVTLP